MNNFKIHQFLTNFNYIYIFVVGWQGVDVVLGCYVIWGYFRSTLLTPLLRPRLHSFFLPYLKPHPDPHKLELCPFGFPENFVHRTIYKRMDLESMSDSLWRRWSTTRTMGIINIILKLNYINCSHRSPYEQPVCTIKRFSTNIFIFF